MIRGSNHPNQRAAAGTALLELAIALPLLCLLLVGAVEFATAAYDAIEVSNAAKAAVQYGAQSAATAANTAAIQAAAAADAADLKGLTTTVSTACICADGSASTCLNTDCSASAIEQVLTVNTQATFTTVFSWTGLPASITLKGQAVQKVLQ